MKKLFSIITVIAVIIGAAILFLYPWQSVTATGTTGQWLADSQPVNGSFKQALAPQKLEFPRDLRWHNDYQTEWW